MGLLDRFLGDIARKSLRDAIDSATGRNAPPPMPTAPLPQQQSQTTLPADYVPDLDIEQKLDKILSTQFPAYGFGKEVREHDALHLRSLSERSAETVHHALLEQYMCLARIPLLQGVCGKSGNPSDQLPRKPAERGELHHRSTPSVSLMLDI